MKVPFSVDLTGKTAIVTGGSGVLCSAMAYGLAVNGAKVAIIGRNKEKLAKMSETLTENAKNEYSKEVTVKGYSCNVLDKEELVKTYEQIKAELGSCDILINGAGGNPAGSHCLCKNVKEGKTGGRLFFLGSEGREYQKCNGSELHGNLTAYPGIYQRYGGKEKGKHYQYRFCFLYPSSFQGYGLFQCKKRCPEPDSVAGAPLWTEWHPLQCHCTGILCSRAEP